MESQSVASHLYVQKKKENKLQNITEKKKKDTEKKRVATSGVKESGRFRQEEWNKRYK